MCEDFPYWLNRVCVLGNRSEPFRQQRSQDRKKQEDSRETKQPAESRSMYFKTAARGQVKGVARPRDTLVPRARIKEYAGVRRSGNERELGGAPNEEIGPESRSQAPLVGNLDERLISFGGEFRFEPPSQDQEISRKPRREREK